MLDEELHETRMRRALLALDGLSVGDALGERCFYMHRDLRLKVAAGEHMPEPRWRYTDDTVMALGIVEVLHIARQVDQDQLADIFARRFDAEPDRGYGNGAIAILTAIDEGIRWFNAADSIFQGQGSFGNGGAMRVAPLGAYFADDIDRLVVEARRSAEITHSHPEGMAGAIAVASASAFAWNHRGESAGADLLAFAASRTPPGLTRDRIEKVRDIPPDEHPRFTALQVGNGTEVTAADTVPFALWCAARHFDDYPGVIQSAISVGGDIDTNCAIAGGVVALSAAEKGIPAEWLAARESLHYAFG